MIDSLRAAAWVRFREHWLTVLLIAGIALSLLQSCADAKWLRDTAPLTAAALLGVLFGWWLAASRFRGRTALLFDLILSTLLVMLMVGRVLPEVLSLFSTPFDQTISSMNARLFTLLEDVRADTGALGLGLIVQTRWFVLTFSWLTWQAGAWLLWSVARRQRALAGLAPVAIILALNPALNRDGPSLPFVFIALAVALIARTAYTHQLREWEKRGVSYPELVNEDWAAWGGLLTAVVIVVTGFSTPEWQHTIDHFIQALRPPAPVSTAVAPAVIEPAPHGSLAASFVPDLRTVGPAFPQSAETIFTVATSDPPSGMNSTGVFNPPLQQHYWRGAIFDRYTGAGWEPLPIDQPTSSTPLTETVPPGRYTLAQKFQIVSLQDDRLFAASQPVHGSDGTALLSAANDPSTSLVRGRTGQYEVVSWAPNVSANDLAGDSTDYPPEIRVRYLQLPDTLPSRVRELAGRLTRGAASPYDKAVRVQDYLRLTYPYRLDVPAPPPNRDVVDYFLFDSPGGFCSYYASAMAVMLRSVGVPARVVTGFASGNYNGQERQYDVPASAAHAWVEVYFPTYGWIEFEPTATRTPFEYRRAESQPSDRLPAPTTAEAPREPIGQLILIGLLTIVIAALAIRAIGLWRQRVLDRSLPPNRQARALYWRMRRDLRRQGMASPGHITPDEFWTQQHDRLQAWPQILIAAQQITALYIQAVFSPTWPTIADVESSRRLWSATRRERWRWRVKNVLARWRRSA